ncbi:OmpA family protein [Sphaerotilus sp.]|uniref:OmpA family protein n=1 Tax=Sphaerotilus sp. TaxID=2093942 RepID=UPI002ACDAA5D|nr:OmpA family protein [Sphaerotilus sp.]MDZ7857536.1 OmpA family protein [Sphaerotilus sp.]
MSRRWWSCPVCTVLGLAGLALLAWLLIGRGDGKADSVRQRTEADAAQVLGAAGFPWARLQIDNEVGRIVGEAPSPAQRAAAYAAASTTLLPMMGVPGVFARLEDGQSSPALALPEVTLAPKVAVAVAGAAAVAAPAVPASAPLPASGPLTAEDCQVAMARVLASKQIRFKLSSAELDPSSVPLLDQLYGLSRRCPQARMRVDGHTDAQGDAAANLRLSQRRAQAVVAALTQRGMPASRLQAQGFGEDRLLDAGSTPEAHERNRRIEFHLAPKAP